MSSGSFNNLRKLLVACLGAQHRPGSELGLPVRMCHRFSISPGSGLLAGSVARSAQESRRRQTGWFSRALCRVAVNVACGFVSSPDFDQAENCLALARTGNSGQGLLCAAARGVDHHEFEEALALVIRQHVRRSKDSGQDNSELIVELDVPYAKPSGVIYSLSSVCKRVADDSFSIFGVEHARCIMWSSVPNSIRCGAERAASHQALIPARRGSPGLSFPAPASLQIRELFIPTSYSKVSCSSLLRHPAQGRSESFEIHCHGSQARSGDTPMRTMACRCTRPWRVECLRDSIPFCDGCARFLPEPLRRLASLVFVARVELQLVEPSPDWAPDTPSLPSASSSRTTPLPHATLWVSPPRDGKLVAVGPVELPPTHRQVLIPGLSTRNRGDLDFGLRTSPIHRQALCSNWAGRRTCRHVGIGGARTARPSIKVFGATPRIVAYFSCYSRPDTMPNDL